MGGFSLWHWLVVGVILLLLFGKGRFSEMMGDVAKGIKSFKKGMSEEDEAQAPQQRLRDDRAAAAQATPVRPATEERPVDPAPVPRKSGERREP